MSKTAEIATGFHGSKLYQERARMVLPVLVRQAKARQAIFYEHLAQEVGMPNPRNLNYPLGCIGDILNNLSKEWKTEIPHIQALVKNQQVNMPGPGFDAFLASRGLTWKNQQERRAIIEEYWTKIYAYPYWDRVLAKLDVHPTGIELKHIIDNAGNYGHTGEGPEHKALKQLICKNPHLAGLKQGGPHGELEYLLPSSDRIDVIFNYPKQVHAVEIKPAKAPIGDITRGLFQCVKYRALLSAKSAYEHDERKITVCLVLGSILPIELIPLRNSLQIDVIENVVAQGCVASRS